MLGLPYEQPAKLVEDYLDVFDAMFSGPDPVDVENDRFRIHNPLDITDLPVPVLLAALGPVMLRIAGERADGTVLWMADERAIAEHVVPRITKAAEGAGRPGAPRRRRRRGVPVRVRRGGRGARAGQPMLGHAEYSPNYQRLLEQGDAGDVGDMAALGTEADVERRLRSYADAGTTDFSARILPMGQRARRDPGLGRPDARVPGVARARPHVSAEHPATRGDLLWGSIPAMAADAAARFGDAHAVVDGDRRVTFTELIGEARRVTGALMASGVEPGDRVAIWSPNRYEWLVAALGTLGAGAAVVPVNTRFKGEEVRYILGAQRRAGRLHRRRVPRDGLRRHRRRPPRRPARARRGRRLRRALEGGSLTRRVRALGRPRRQRGGRRALAGGAR